MSWENAPQEVNAYFQSGPHRPVSVRAIKPYLVSVTFDNGVTKTYDYSGKFTGILSDLNDPALFQQVYLDDTHSIAWDTPKGHMDFSSDTVYIYGETHASMQESSR